MVIMKTAFSGMERRAALLLVFFGALLMVGVQGQLSVDFYNATCPNAAAIIKAAAQAQFEFDEFSVPSLLRIFAHDALVNGVDGSILIRSRKSELTAPDNVDLTPNGFDAVIAAKARLEKECKGVVSCADIVAALTRDLLTFVGGPNYPVKFGRRDSRVSLAKNVFLPGADDTFDHNAAIFAKLGMTNTDVVAVSGAHSIGFTHCSSIHKRLYNFSATAARDPALDPALGQMLEANCPKVGGDPGLLVPLDPNSVSRFDRVFWKNLKVGQGVLGSDQILFTDRRFRGLVNRFSKSTPAFFNAFSTAMVKMSEANVLTGSAGEIRLDCTRVNKVKKIKS